MSGKVRVSMQVIGSAPKEGEGKVFFLRISGKPDVIARLEDAIAVRDLFPGSRPQIETSTRKERVITYIGKTEADVLVAQSEIENMVMRLNSSGASQSPVAGQEEEFSELLPGDVGSLPELRAAKLSDERERMRAGLLWALLYRGIGITDATDLQDRRGLLN